MSDDQEKDQPAAAAGEAPKQDKDKDDKGGDGKDWTGVPPPSGGGPPPGH